MNNKKTIIIGVVALLIVIGVIIYILSNKNYKENSAKNENEAKDVLDNSKNENTEGETGENKKLVAYFSVAGEVYNVGTVDVGNTAIMSSYIVDYLKADSFEIVPVKPYTTIYKDLIEVAKEEQRNNARPEIKNKISNFEEYDTIFIGYPIWWGDLPPIVYTFLEEYDFSGKTVIPFNTHEGSGISGTYDRIKNKLSNANVNTNGLALQGKVSRTDDGKSETINWLKNLGY